MNVYVCMSLLWMNVPDPPVLHLPWTCQVYPDSSSSAPAMSSVWHRLLSDTCIAFSLSLATLDTSYCLLSLYFLSPFSSLSFIFLHSTYHLWPIIYLPFTFPAKMQALGEQSLCFVPCHIPCTKNRAWTRMVTWIC